jgi:hypothetical protein
LFVFGTIANFFPIFIHRLAILPEATGAWRARHTKCILALVVTSESSLFMSGSLTGFFRAEVYLIHEMHSTDVFFHPPTSMAEEKPPFV